MNKYPRIKHRMKATRAILFGYGAALTTVIVGLWLVWWVSK